MTAAGGINDSLFLDIAFSPVCMDSVFMTPIHAKVASTEKYGDQYRLIVDLVPSEISRAIRTVEIQEESLLRFLQYVSEQKLAYPYSPERSWFQGG
jgi:hypothetical protein